MIAVLVLVIALVVAGIGLITGAVRLWRARTGVFYRVCAGLLVVVGLDLLLLVVAIFVGPLL